MFDSGSWGQYIGGTAKYEGKDIGFSDPTHIIGMSMRLSSCRPILLCSDNTHNTHNTHNNNINIDKDTDIIYTDALSEEEIEEEVGGGGGGRGGGTYSIKKSSNLMSDNTSMNETINVHDYQFKINNKTLCLTNIQRSTTSTISTTSSLSSSTSDTTLSLTSISIASSSTLYSTTPYVKCTNSDIVWPLYNLHVHSKQTHKFISQPCSCTQN